MKIQVPASSANLGPGFDSIGIALSLYLNVEIMAKASKWYVDHNLGSLPHDEHNMIVKTALRLAPGLHPHHIRVTSDIPVAHGLGSSSSAIVAGIELANYLADLHMTDEHKVEFASQLEGHPDNVAPTILGGLVVGTSVNDHFDAIKAPLLPYDFVAYIPSYNLATKKARAALPQTLPYSQATHASSIANTLVAALFQQNYKMVGELMEADQFHEQYRAELVPELLKIRQLAHLNCSLATYLSGAGPTVMTIMKHKQVSQFIDSLREHQLKGRIEILHPDQAGIVIK